MSHQLKLLSAFVTLSLLACDSSSSSNTQGSDYLYVWAGDADTVDPDFLVVFDVLPGSPTYGQTVSSISVEGREHWPRHLEHGGPHSSTLFANGWGSGSTFVFDFSQPELPTVKSVFGAVGDYAFPHSYARLPNGNVLATFQSSSVGYAPPGGLVELDQYGKIVRSASARASRIPDSDVWPYSLLVLPDIDRVITTNTRLGTPAEWRGDTPISGETNAQEGRNSAPSHIQVWRLSDLQLLKTLHLPSQGNGHNIHTAEPRRLANGDIYVNTFSCGIYRIDGIESAEPVVEPVLYAPANGEGWCGVPVVLGNYWIQPTADRALVTYDLNDRASPREVSRLQLDSAFRSPHWLALDPVTPRIVVTPDVVTTADSNAWVLLVDVDPKTGRLTIDEDFRDVGSPRAGVSFNRSHWPHGAGGRALPHAAVFGLRRGR